MANKKRAPGQNIGIEIDPATINKFKKRFPKGTQIINYNAISFLKGCPYLNDPNTLIYIDPPYPLGSRKQQKKVYRYELTDQDHVELLKIIRKAKAKIIISTYPNEIYKKYLKHWHVETFMNQTRKGKATELLYMNFLPPEVLHDFSFIGRDFTERQRIKRKIKNQIRILSNLHPLERSAIFHALRSSGVIE